MFIIADGIWDIAMKNALLRCVGSNLSLVYTMEEQITIIDTIWVSHPRPPNYHVMCNCAYLKEFINMNGNAKTHLNFVKHNTM